MNREKLLKLQSQVRIGGKGTPRRKKKVVHQTPNTDDKKLQSVLKKISVNLIPGIEEVNMIKNDGTVIYFNNPKTQASLATNTFAITGHSEIKSITEMMPSILPFGKLEDVLKYTRLADDMTAANLAADIARGITKDNAKAAADDDDVPDLVADFEETANKDIERETAKLQINEPKTPTTTTTAPKEEATITEIL